MFIRPGYHRPGPTYIALDLHVISSQFTSFLYLLVVCSYDNNNDDDENDDGDEDDDDGKNDDGGDDRDDDDQWQCGPTADKSITAPISNDLYTSSPMSKKSNMLSSILISLDVSLSGSIFDPFFFPVAGHVRGPYEGGGGG